MMEALAREAQATTEPLDPRVEKLPLWAQGYITRLNAQIAVLRRTVDTLQGDEERVSNTVAEPFGKYAGRVRMPLADGTTVRFIHGSERAEEYVDVRVSDGEVDINGGTMLIVRPRSGNHLSLRSERWVP